jgi:uncharacterized protein (TIGR00255 family)
MIKSMTGFGRSDYSDGKRDIVAEVKSVNHRYCDINIKMPRRYSFAEEKLKTIVKEIAKRGKIDLSLSIDNLAENDTGIRLNTALAGQYYENLKELKSSLSLNGEITLSLLASQPDVMRPVPQLEDEDIILESLAIPVREAVKRFDNMRVLEGEKLAEDIVMRGRLILNMAREISQQSEKVVLSYKTKLAERIKDLLEGAAQVPEERIALEAALFADKSNIDEELVRLSSHLNQLEQIITKSNQPEGKKLDFLVQEMNREANTIGSKANDITITNLVLEMKSEIEKIREQVQNIE